MTSLDRKRRHDALMYRLGAEHLSASAEFEIQTELDALVRAEVEEASQGAAILDLQVRPCTGPQDLPRYIVDLGAQAATNAARQREDELMAGFFGSIRNARTRP